MPGFRHALLHASEPQGDTREVRRSSGRSLVTTPHPQGSPSPALSHATAAGRETNPGAPCLPAALSPLYTSVLQPCAQPSTGQSQALLSRSPTSRGLGCHMRPSQVPAQSPPPRICCSRQLSTAGWAEGAAAVPLLGGGARAALVHKEVTAAATVFRPHDSPGMPRPGRGTRGRHTRTEATQRDSILGRGARDGPKGPASTPGTPGHTLALAPGPVPGWPQDRAGGRRPAQGQCGEEHEEQQGWGHEGPSDGVSLRQQNGELGGGGGGGSGCSGERSPRLPLLPTIKQQFLPQPPR